MNCDQHNAENLKDLIKELSQTFEHRGNFSMYVWPIFEEGFTRTPEEKERLYKSVLELEKLLLSLDYPISHALDHRIRGTHCMCDSGDTVTISPKGDLGICEHYIDKDFIGHINTPYKKDFDIIKSWRDYVKPIELCKDCPSFPQCLKMNKCPDEVACEQHQKNYWLEHYKLAMISEWKMRQNNRGQCNNCGNPNNNNN